MKYKLENANPTFVLMLLICKIFKIKYKIEHENKIHLRNLIKL